MAQAGESRPAGDDRARTGDGSRDDLAQFTEGLTVSGAAVPHRKGMAQLASGEDFSVADAVGGPRGVVESAVPGVTFVVTYVITQSLSTSTYAAVGIAAVFAAARLVRREPIYPAISGLVGVAIAAFIARQTGRAEDFYLPGLFINIGFGLAYLISILVRWPLLGVLIGPLTEEGFSWRSDPARLRAYTQASAIWVAVFAVRLAVQVPLYLLSRRCDAQADASACAEALGLLGTARVAMGLPLFALAAYLSWLILRRVPPARPAEDAPNG